MREEGRPNNGMKLTARGASVEARQLIPVLGGHLCGTIEPSNALDRARTNEPERHSA
jgi:hypothetical protein